LGWIGEAYRLTTEDSLAESVVEEGVLHIELLNRSIAGGSNGEHRAGGGRLHNRAKSLVVVNLGALCETLEDLASLVAIERPVRKKLVTTLEPQGQGTSSHVRLLIRAHTPP
jgi:hypothetical protein